MPHPTDPFASAFDLDSDLDAPQDQGLANAAMEEAEGEVSFREGSVTTSDGTKIQAQEIARPEPTEEERQEVEAWWARTDDVAGYQNAEAQYRQDLCDLELLNGSAKRDDATIATNLIYLNSRQTVAMMAPSDHGVRWDPTPDIDLVEGDSFDPANPDDMALKEAKQRWDVARKGFSQCLNKSVPVLAKKGKIQEHLEAYAQEGTHFQTACLSVFWQPEEGPRPSANTTSNDSKRTSDNIRRIGSAIATDSVIPETGDINAIQRQTETLQTEQPFTDWGLYYTNVPPVDWRIDESILGFEDREKATWWSTDVYMTDDEIVEQFEGISVTDLQRSDVPGYTLSAHARDGGTTSQNGGWTRCAGVEYDSLGLPYIVGADDKRERLGAFTRKVREVWDAIARERLVLIEGLSGYALREPFPVELGGRFPMELLCFNRRHRSVYGFSDTQLQAPTQRRINKLRTDEEGARDASKPRWGMDASKTNVAPGKIILDVSTKKAGSVIALDLAGETADKAFYPLFSNNSFNPINYDSTKLEQELRKEAALPEQSLGVTGSADFATEVQVAAQGANIATKHRQERMERALQTIYDLSARYVVWNMTPEKMAEISGPLALRYWPADPNERLALYDSMSLEVKVAFNEEMDNAKRLDALTRFLQATQAAGQPIDPAVFSRMAARILGEEELEDAINPDPTAAARILAQALAQGGPGALPPEAQQALVAIVEQTMTSPEALAASAERTLAQESAEGAPL